MRREKDQEEEQVEVIVRTRIVVPRPMSEVLLFHHPLLRGCEPYPCEYREVVVIYSARPHLFRALHYAFLLTLPRSMRDESAAVTPQPSLAV